MSRLLRILGLSGTAAVGVAGFVQATLSLAGPTDLPRAAQPLAAAELVAPAPEAYSSIVTTRDWQEVDTSGSSLRPRGTSSSNTGFSPAPRPAPLLAESAAASVPASTSIATPTSSPASVSNPAFVPTVPASTADSSESPMNAYILALRASILQSEAEKSQPKTKTSKKSPRGTTAPSRS